MRTFLLAFIAFCSLGVRAQPGPLQGLDLPAACALTQTDSPCTQLESKTEICADLGGREAQMTCTCSSNLPSLAQACYDCIISTEPPESYAAQILADLKLSFSSACGSITSASISATSFESTSTAASTAASATESSPAVTSPQWTSDSNVTSATTSAAASSPASQESSTTATSTTANTTSTSTSRVASAASSSASQPSPTGTQNVAGHATIDGLSIVAGLLLSLL